jgi:hypothetical protein
LSSQATGTVVLKVFADGKIPMFERRGLPGLFCRSLKVLPSADWRELLYAFSGGLTGLLVRP